MTEPVTGTGAADDGMIEVSVVTGWRPHDDIALGLGLAIDPPRDVCTRVLARLFPEAAQELAGVDPWAALRWSTGRIELPGRPQLKEWRWRGAPLGE